MKLDKSRFQSASILDTIASQTEEKMKTRSAIHRKTLLVAIAFSFVELVGCTPAEKQEITSDLQTALADLTQNRALMEQFGRDVKSSVDPTDPTYSNLMQSYEEARDEYNHYLDQVELAASTHNSSDALIPSIQRAQEASTQFLSGATRTLAPNSNVRGLAFRKAVVFPESLTRDLNLVPKRMRRNLINTFDDQVRMRSWGKL